MPYDLSKVLVVGISSRALFDLEKENELFDTHGLEAYTAYQIEKINDIPRPGTGFRLVKNILSLNEEGKDRRVEVIVLSRNNPATSLRITKAIQHHELDITRSAWTGGESLVRYLSPYKVDLFLSAHQKDVQRAINAGFAVHVFINSPKINRLHVQTRKKSKLPSMVMQSSFQQNPKKYIKLKGSMHF